MRIGIDIDNVISKFNDKVINEALKYDKTLRGNGIININFYITNGMFDWTKEETNKFLKDNIDRIGGELELVEDSKEYINKLKKDKHEIFIITGRDNGEYTDHINMTKEWLKKNDIYYDELIFTDGYKYNKHLICKEKNINIMIDDSKNVCKNCIDSGINVLLMDTIFNKDLNIKRVYNWKEIYEYISKM